MGIIISTIFPTKNQNPKHLNRPRSTSPTKSMISHPYPLGTQMLTTSVPTSPESHAQDQTGMSSRFGRGKRSMRGSKRGLSNSHSTSIGEHDDDGDDADGDGFRRLLSPSPLATLLDINEEESQQHHQSLNGTQDQNQDIHPGIITVDDHHDNRNKLKKVIKVEGDWDLIRSSDLDGI